MHAFSVYWCLRKLNFQNIIGIKYIDLAYYRDVKVSFLHVCEYVGEKI